MEELHSTLNLLTKFFKMMLELFGELDHVLIRSKILHMSPVPPLSGWQQPRRGSLAVKRSGTEREPRATA